MCCVDSWSLDESSLIARSFRGCHDGWVVFGVRVKVWDHKSDVCFFVLLGLCLRGVLTSGPSLFSLCSLVK